MPTPSRPPATPGSGAEPAERDSRAIARDPEIALPLRLYLKFEGSNPTGTQKDRIAHAQVGDALRRGFDSVCVASRGNHGVAGGVLRPSGQPGLGLPQDLEPPR